MRAVILNLAAWIVLPIMDGFAKFLSTDLPVLQITWARYFFTVFFVWIFQYINDKNNDFLQRSALFIAIFLFLDNFGYMGGANGSIQIQMVGKTDTAVAIIWVLISMLIINDLLKKNSNQNQFFLILTLGLFAFQLKSNAAPLIFLILFYVFKFRKTFSFVNFQNIMLLILLNLFLVKNFLVSGCVLYPLSFTCFKKVIF